MRYPSTSLAKSFLWLLGCICLQLALTVRVHADKSFSSSKKGTAKPLTIQKNKYLKSRLGCKVFSAPNLLELEAQENIYVERLLAQRYGVSTTEDDVERAYRGLEEKYGYTYQQLDDKIVHRHGSVSSYKAKLRLELTFMRVFYKPWYMRFWEINNDGSRRTYDPKSINTDIVIAKMISRMRSIRLTNEGGKCAEVFPKIGKESLNFIGIKKIDSADFFGVESIDRRLFSMIKSAALCETQDELTIWYDGKPDKCSSQQFNYVFEQFGFFNAKMVVEYSKIESIFDDPKNRSLEVQIEEGKTLIGGQFTIAIQDGLDGKVPVVRKLRSDLEKLFAERYSGKRFVPFLIRKEVDRINEELNSEREHPETPAIRMIHVKTTVDDGKAHMTWLLRRGESPTS